jgi:hypothetical protein
VSALRIRVVQLAAHFEWQPDRPAIFEINGVRFRHEPRVEDAEAVNAVLLEAQKQTTAPQSDGGGR